MKQNFRGSWHVRALLLLCLTFQIPWGGELSHAAQTAQQNTIRIGNVTNLKELIRQIEAQTSYKVSYQGNLADNITIKADPSKHNVEELLADALRGTGISYVIRYNTIILTQEQPRAEAAQQASQTRHIAGSMPRPRSRSSARRSGSRIRRWERTPTSTEPSTTPSRDTTATSPSPTSAIRHRSSPSPTFPR